MGIFDDEARKMEEDAAQQARPELEHVAELNKVARDISRELLNYLENHSKAEGLDIDVHGNIVGVTTRHRTLEIICDGREAFHLNDRNNGFQQVMTQPPPPVSTRGTPISRSDMVRRVLRWLQVHRVA